MSDESFTEITEALKRGGIAVVRTDTIYGIIALASNEAAVEKVYAAKHRDPLKQCIILIPRPESVPTHAVQIAAYSLPDQSPISVIVPKSNEPAWLLRGGDTIAYRAVRDAFLKQVVEAVGPVIAPSANPEGLEPARTVEQARDYFGDAVDAYVDGGEVPEDVHASRIVKVDKDGSVTTIRS